jgi:hypothetical protein
MGEGVHVHHLPLCNSTLDSPILPLLNLLALLLQV